MANPIENFLYQNSPMAKGYYGQFPISEGFKSELGLSKQFPYEGFSAKYQGPDKASLPSYINKGFKSIFGNVPSTGIGGGTVGQRIIYENMLKYLGKAGRFAGAINRLPVLGAASDVLFGTRNTMNTVDDINRLGQFISNKFKSSEQVRQQILGQTPQQIINQQIASRNPNRGNVQAPTMTAQQIVQEAKDTGGTVNPFEVTKAAESSYSRRPNMADVSRPSSSSSSRPRNSPSSSSRPKNSPSSRQSSYSNVRRYGRADGGMVSLMDLLNRKV